jgi:hypothetical protein
VGSPEPLLVKSPTVTHPNHISPDGRFLIYDDHTAQGRQDLWVLPLDPPQGGERKAFPFLATQADETFGQFSPDGNHFPAPRFVRAVRDPLVLSVRCQPRRTISPQHDP